MYLGGGGTHDLKTLAALRVHEVWLHALLPARSGLLRKRPNVAWRWVVALGGGVGSAILAAVISPPSLLPPFLSLLSPLSSFSFPSPLSPPSPSPPLRGGGRNFSLALGGGITALGHIEAALGGVGSYLEALGDSVVDGVGSEAGSVPGRWVAGRGVGWRWVASGAVGCRGGDEVGWTIDMSTPGFLAGYLEAMGVCWRGAGSTMRLRNEVGHTSHQVVLHVRDHSGTFRRGLL